jgi:hypothetical protein
MKSLLHISTLVFLTLMFSSSSFAGWTKVTENTVGSTYYVDFERMIKHDGYVYWWDLQSFLIPNKDGNWSYQLYRQGDCRLFRSKVLSVSYYKKPMGGGTGETNNDPEKNWTYPSPNSVIEVILESVCSR